MARGTRFETTGLAMGWKTVLDEAFGSSAGQALLQFLAERESSGAVIYPPDPYSALRFVMPEDVQVVIFGQDPYHGPGQAVGMAFSVPAGHKPLPPSLRNIFKEIAREYGTSLHCDGDLTSWATQGVLLLNTVLSVEHKKPGSHAKKGWEEITDAILKKVLCSSRPKVFLLWGAWAQAKENIIREHATGAILVLKANHPSPLSALRPPVPFIGCNHFRQANVWLQAHGSKGVDWAVCQEEDLFGEIDQ